MGFIIFFVIVFIVVLAFSSNKKEETITRTDKESGQTIVEKRVVESPSVGRSAARIVLWTIAILISMLLLFSVCALAVA
ncbi:MAG: hypothetical protein JXK93_05590 [Sphaerochaetaceae bacterium]|nr:hypothetical protein [Sphaerochaetaceae bacterium]